jgi:beta-D-galactosyl-(1->4)-L-rhamnose phosphorylase
MKNGSFTLPGEAGFEKLTLELAKRWGADVIRDSDGTKLSDEITNAGYGIYSTICIIREHNEWAKKNTDKLQQTFLCTEPVIAADSTLEISLMKDFFAEQFKINDSERAMKYWQVFDRTEDREIGKDSWSYDASKGTVTLKGIAPWHEYTVSFLAYRIWEEISMYNHTTNNWTKEHLMQIDPIWPETREYLRNWMDTWCKEHPTTTVVRFTSMFYNFVWIWGSSERNRHLFSDWASYDFTVSDLALDLFKEQFGYSMTAEDFINKGKLHVTHTPGNKRKADWMKFVNNNVIDFGRELVDLVHSYGKKAYMFYDDSWVGTEPYSDRFTEFGFDGIIKCIFSGFEIRLCAGVKAETHEIRLHPYLFPVGLGGLPTFAPGGDPARDARKYWISARRALLRAKIDRLGLGGYLHLVQDYPDFVQCIEDIADEFRTIKELHEAGAPYVIKTKVAVLHYWGSLRSWTLSGHFHETYMNDLIHVNEALSGLPVDVSFISFEDVKKGCLKDYDVVINAGAMNSAWSGGSAWNDTDLVSRITEWVYNGGTFIGVNEPSATPEGQHVFKTAGLLGVDEDTIDEICHGKWKFDIDKKGAEKYIPNGAFIKLRSKAHLTDGDASVFAEEDGHPVFTEHRFGKGRAFWLSSFETTPENNRMLLNILADCQKDGSDRYITDNLNTECAFYPAGNVLVVINNTEEEQTTAVKTDFGTRSFELKPCETRIVKL